MKDDVPAAAVRLCASLPVTTHTQPCPGERRGENMRRRNYRLTQQPGIGRGNNQGKRVAIDGREFRNVKAVKQHFHISSRTFYDWIDRRKARYL